MNDATHRLVWYRNQTYPSKFIHLAYPTPSFLWYRYNYTFSSFQGDHPYFKHQLKRLTQKSTNSLLLTISAVNPSDPGAAFASFNLRPAPSTLLISPHPTAHFYLHSFRFLFELLNFLPQSKPSTPQLLSSLVSPYPSHHTPYPFSYFYHLSKPTSLPLPTISRGPCIPTCQDSVVCPLQTFSKLGPSHCSFIHLSLLNIDSSFFVLSLFITTPATILSLPHVCPSSDLQFPEGTKVVLFLPLSRSFFFVSSTQSTTTCQCRRVWSGTLVTAPLQPISTILSDMVVAINFLTTSQCQ